VGRLVEAYRSSGRGAGAGTATVRLGGHTRHDGHGADDGDDGVLEGALARLVARGRAAHPGLDVAEGAFAAHLGRCGAIIEDPTSDPQVADLYLCCAALLRVDEAIRILCGGLHDTITKSLRAIEPSSSFVAEVEQRFWSVALVGPIDGPPKLASYAGRGPLSGWVGVAAQRLALTTMRHESAERRAVASAAAEARIASADPELAFLKGDLRDAFQGALQRALQILDDRQRMVYRLHLVDGLTVERIARTYGVVRSTVTRWLTEARVAIVREVKRQLRDEMRLPPEEFDSVARLLASQLDLSVSRILVARAS